MRNPGMLIVMLLLGTGLGFLLGGLTQEDAPRMTRESERVGELEAEILTLRDQLAALRDAPPLSGSTDEPETTPPGVAPQLEGRGEAMPAQRGTATPAPPIWNRWRTEAPPGFEIPEGLEGSPKVWLEAMKQAVAKKDHRMLMHARTAIVGLGPDGRALMRETFRDAAADPTLRGAAWDALRIVDEQAAREAITEELAQGLEPGAWRTQLLVRYASTRPKEPPPARVLELLDDRDAPQQDHDAVLLALMASDPTRAMQELRLMLDGRDGGERSRALRLLQRATDPVFAPLVREVIPTLDEKARSSYTNALAAMKGKGWDDVQMTGEPDTWGHADQQTAWASLKAQEGIVTVTLWFGQAVVPAAIRIHESFNPGAIIRIDVGGGGSWTLAYEGEASPVSGPRWFEPALEDGLGEIRVVRITLDTSAVSGWNEIDAVELVGGGLRQWATGATSSSCYARR